MEIIVPSLCYSLMTRDYQLTAGLTSIFSQIDMKDCLASLGVICGQHVESPSRCWHSRPGLLLQSLAAQISHYAGDRTWDLCARQ